MKKYVIKDNHYFEVSESKGRYVITPDENNIVVLNEIFIEEKQNFYSSMINNFLNEEVPLAWIKKEFIRDYEFVKEYHPEYLF